MNELGTSVLIVDDELILAKALGRMLRRTFDVTISTCVPDALMTIRQQGEFGFILTDIRMPGQDGLDLYHTLLERDPDLADRVIFMTAEASVRNLPRLQRLPNPILAKPFSRADLLAAVESLPSRHYAHPFTVHHGLAAG